jgi:serine/threonine-protein kinase
MEYIEGRPLQGPLPEPESIRLAIQIASALEEAHRRGIIHRDLKPGNVIVTSDGTAKLLDFGLAKSTRDADTTIEMTATLEGTIIGTTAYMSPEQASGKTLDARSDIFSFGAVLYEMISGKRAFDGHSTTEILARVIRDDPTPLNASEPLSRTVRRCLSKQAAQRFQTASELKGELERIQPRSVSREPSIAVLPFANMSADKENEYFSDGLAEEIINALAHIPGLKVTARTSAFAFRGQEQDIRKIASTLGVRTILEGSVRRAGNRIRVTAQLIDAEDGYHLWSERYDRELADVFAMQDEIAEAIASALKVQLSSSRQIRRYTPDLSAYEAVLRARHAFAKFSPASLARSREYYKEAIALDPRYALARCELSQLYLFEAIAGVLPAHEAMPRVREDARRALEIDANLPEAHAILGTVAGLYDYNWAEAAREFRLAIAEEPISAMVRTHYAMYFLGPSGRFPEALLQIEQSMQADPLFVPHYHGKATCLAAVGRLDEAESAMRKGLELDENFSPGWSFLGSSFFFHGKFERALEMARRAYELTPWPLFLGPYAGLLMRTGDTKRAEEALQKLGDTQAYGVPAALTLFHFIVGDLEKAADCMDKAIEQRYPLVPGFLRGPVGQALQKTSRWAELARKVRLPGLGA